MGVIAAFAACGAAWPAVQVGTPVYAQRPQYTDMLVVSVDKNTFRVSELSEISVRYRAPSTRYQ